MRLSDFGQRLGGDTDMAKTMFEMSDSQQSVVARFGGGNPAHIAAVTNTYIKAAQKLFADHETAETMLGDYDAPRGNPAFVAAVRDLLNREYHLGVTEANITVTAGSQTGYFILLNLLAGTRNDMKRKLLFPLTPDYLGYDDVVVEPGCVTSRKPLIHKIGVHEFQYGIDFDTLDIDEQIAALCLSRPTNPSGNVVTDNEMSQLGQLARRHDIPLIIDCAYGEPFPGIMAPGFTLHWDDHTIMSLSLSKIGLPSAHVGIFVGPPDIMAALGRASSLVSLAPPSLGEYLMRPLIEHGDITRLVQEDVQPYYLGRVAKAHDLIRAHFPDELPWRLHTWQGTFFFWLWLEGARVIGRELHDDLRSLGVVTVPGSSFFPGSQDASWRHPQECLRLDIARPDTELEAGIVIMGKAMRKAY